jgi:hypothetical protein
MRIAITPPLRRRLGTAADGNLSVLAARCFLLHRSRLATVSAPLGPARGRADHFFSQLT